MADVNTEFGAKALKEIEEEFGPDRAIFVLTDATNVKEFESMVDKFLRSSYIKNISFF